MASQPSNTRAHFKTVQTLREVSRLDDAALLVQIHRRGSLADVNHCAMQWVAHSTALWRDEPEDMCEQAASYFGYLSDRCNPHTPRRRRVNFSKALNSIKIMLRRGMNDVAAFFMCSLAFMTAKVPASYITTQNRMPELCEWIVDTACAQPTKDNRMLLGDYTLMLFNVASVHQPVRNTHKLEKWLKSNRVETLLSAFVSWRSPPGANTVAAAIEMVNWRVLALDGSSEKIEADSSLGKCLDVCGVPFQTAFLHRLLDSIPHLNRDEMEALQDFCLLALGASPHVGIRAALSLLALIGGQKRMCGALFPAISLGISPQNEMEEVNLAPLQHRDLSEQLSSRIAHGLQQAMLSVGMTGRDFEGAGAWAMGTILDHLPKCRPSTQMMPSATLLLPAECPICMCTDRPLSVMAPCGHVFCAVCKPWIMAACHMCKRTVMAHVQTVYGQ